MTRFGRLAALFAIVGAALLLRVWIPYPIVFRDGAVNFQEGDAWYHMRVVENFVHHAPHRLRFDPYAIHPGGQEIAIGPLYDALIGWAAIAAGLGAPSLAVVQTVGAWFPAVLGALIPIPVFFIGELLFGRRAAILAAVLIAVTPGIFLRISQLGFTDHHVAEALLSTLAIGLLLRSTQAAETRKGVAWAAASGVALGAYLDTWVGGAFFLAILILWGAAQCLVDRLRKQPFPQRAPILLAVAFLVAAVVFLPASRIPYADFSMFALLAGGAGVLALGWLATRKVSRTAFAGLAVAAAGAATALGAAFFPKAFHAIPGLLGRFAPDAPYVTELRPLLYFTGHFSLAFPIANFGLSIFLAAAALPVLAWRTWRAPSPSATLFFWWCALTLAATLGQVRMIAYAAVPVALLAGFACDAILRTRRAPLRRLAWALVVCSVIAPDLPLAARVLRQDTGPSREWRAALEWLRDHTPEPFGSASFYNAAYSNGAAPAAYGVMNWWDHGYWIVAIAHRVPVSNATQSGAGIAARFYSAAAEEDASAVMRRAGARYVAAAAGVAFWDAPYFTHEPAAAAPRYFETARFGDGAATVYYPEYFRTMAVRLDAFDGLEVRPSGSTWVIRREVERDSVRIASARRFDDFEAALRWRARQWSEHPDADFRIASFDPWQSCVPLPALRDYRLVYRSRAPDALALDPARDAVKIFEFSPTPRQGTGR